MDINIESKAIKFPPFKYSIGYTYSNEDLNFTIIDRKYRTRQKLDKRYNHFYSSKTKHYQIECNKCGHKTWRIEYLIESKHTCPVCGKSKKIVVAGINDISTTDPWMVKYFINGLSEAQKYSYGNKKRIDMICPDCNAIHKSKSIYAVWLNKHLTCHCQDSISYPNKFLYSMFTQLGVNFETEKKFDWSGRKLYDDYVQLNDGITLICENHGGWHYIENQYEGSRNLQEEINNDKIKKELAFTNGINYYITLDCRYSNKEWIKTSIINSELNNLFDLSTIDFNACNEFATKSFVKYVCEFYESHKNMQLIEISKSLKICKSTLRQYLLRGNELGYCIYNMEFHRIKALKHVQDLKSKPIYCYELDKYYHNRRVFADSYFEDFGKRLGQSDIGAVCLGKKKHVNNLHFKFITRNEFNNLKETCENKTVGDYFYVA